MKRILMIVAVLVLTLGFGSGVKAQPSLADTVYLTIEGSEAASGAETNGAFVVNVFVSFSTGNMTGATLGITWDRHFTTPDAPSHTTSEWQFDSIVYQGAFAPGGAWFTVPTPNATPDSIGGVTVGGVSFSGGVLPGPDQLMAKIFLSLNTVNNWTAGSEVTLDSTFLPPASEFLLIFPSATVTPTFLGAKKVTFNDIKLDDGSVLPTSFELSQNYPNPFNPSTKINYTLASKSLVTLEVYNVLGQTVKTLISGVREAGVWEVTWDGDSDNGSQVASGMYFYKLTAGDFVQTRKMLLMK
ncbi:T9SS type A sorting domain-containing protein [bacterium AH-315-J21]|nr:T9SS type A sorting domain-containing protein [bacterium AH-315-J21]